MPWPVYSRRFFIVSVANSWVGVTVPAGQVYVVCSLLATNLSTTSVTFLANGAGSVLWKGILQANAVSANTEMRQVINGGEIIQGHVDNAQGRLWVSGFSLSTGGAAIEDPEIDYDMDPPDWFVELQ